MIIIIVIVIVVIIIIIVIYGRGHLGLLKGPGEANILQHSQIYIYIYIYTHICMYIYIYIKHYQRNPRSNYQRNPRGDYITIQSALIVRPEGSGEAAILHRVG